MHDRVMLPWSNADGIGALLSCGLARGTRRRTTGSSPAHVPRRPAVPAMC